MKKMGMGEWETMNLALSVLSCWVFTLYFDSYVSSYTARVIQ